jgi:hypothetical protein
MGMQKKVLFIPGFSPFVFTLLITFAPLGRGFKGRSGKHEVWGGKTPVKVRSPPAGTPVVDPPSSRPLEKTHAYLE